MNYTPLQFETNEERESYLRTRYTSILGELVVNKLIYDGFLKAPASTKYHSNYPGGLFDHSVNVAQTLHNLTLNNALKWSSSASDRSPWVIGLLHDLCKIDQYRTTYIEDPVTHDVDIHIEWNNNPIIKGHGMKSVIYAQAIGARLSEEERACIIYHMGAFTDAKEWGDYTQAVHRFPNVLWTHHADMIASHIMEV